ncbi:MAG: hypothetical protein LUQ50_00695 [Methanospirillum sp.]|uniref:hypothetical protein n=1 Tax=Methanospirillum sp. TaxID=45200 RepID=UPI00236B22EA|nr:hypothetical protein [Methanospirillum sp.]MDD1727570.1 hypothetical protein [Methanospirillum sp.]
MISYRNDRVLLIVGLLLVIAIIGWIAVSAIIPAKPVEPGKKVTRYTSTGKAFGDSPCCKNYDLGSAGCQSGSYGCQRGQQGCQKTCTQSGSPRCGIPLQSG